MLVRRTVDLDSRLLSHRVQCRPVPAQPRRLHLRLPSASGASSGARPRCSRVLPLIHCPSSGLPNGGGTIRAPAWGGVADASAVLGRPVTSTLHQRCTLVRLFTTARRLWFPTHNGRPSLEPGACVEVRAACCVLRLAHSVMDAMEGGGFRPLPAATLCTACGPAAGNEPIALGPADAGRRRGPSGSPSGLEALSSFAWCNPGGQDGQPSARSRRRRRRRPADRCHPPCFDASMPLARPRVQSLLCTGTLGRGPSDGFHQRLGWWERVCREGEGDWASLTRPAGTESMGSGAGPWRWAPAWVISSAGQQGAVGAQCPARPGTDGPLQASYERAPTSSSVHPSGLCPRLGRAGKGWTVPAQQRQHSSGKREGGRNPSRRARRARAASAFWRVSWNQARSREMGPAYPSRQGLDAGTEEGTAECGRSSDRRRRLLECEGPPFLALGVAPERHGGVTVWLRWCDCAPTGDTLPSASGGLRRWRRRGSSYRRQQRWWLRGRGTGYLAYLRGAHARGGRRLATGCGMKARRRRGHAERRPAFRPFCRGRVDDCPVQKRPGAARAQG